MSKLGAGIFLGLLVGAAAVLLLTPQSGADLKSCIQDRFEQVMAEGRRAAAERRAELEAQFAAAKQTAGR
jgi:gas vesicle protein